MFILDFLSLFINLSFIRYIFVAFAFYGVFLCLKKLIFNR